MLPLGSIGILNTLRSIIVKKNRNKKRNKKHKTNSQYTSHYNNKHENPMLKTLTNKHLIIAMIVAPLLAVIAYYGVDRMVSEKPHKAVEGNYYPLAAKSNCRYQSGECTLENGDISVTITMANTQDMVDLLVTANHSLQNIQVALAESEQSPAPTNMQTQNDEQTQWQLRLPGNASEKSRLQIALAVDNTVYFGETGTTFSQYQTGFTLKQ